MLSPSLLSRMKADGRLSPYLVTGEGKNGQDLIELEPIGQLPLAAYVASFRRQHGGEDDDGLPSPDGVGPLEVSRQTKLHFDAAAEKLKFEQRSAELISKAVVERVLAGAVRQVHARANAITPRILEALGPLTLEQKLQVEALLAPQFENALQGLQGITFAGAEPEPEEELG